MLYNEHFEPINIVKADVFILQAKINVPVKTSFGSMSYRPSLLIRLEDKEGAFGWGEVWCNFPTGGETHRALILKNIILPLLLSQQFDEAKHIYSFLTDKTHILMIQSGEFGPILQCIAGIDLAIWDLFARKIGKPLYRLFKDKQVDKIPVYASGINPEKPWKTIAENRAKGHRAFKLKIGFNSEIDFFNIYKTIEQLGENETLMLDANQAWTLEEAKRSIQKLCDLPIQWIEEPLAADRPENEWAELSSGCNIPISAGENVIGINNFSNIIKSGFISVIQPDVCKWGGVTKCLQVSKLALANGKRYCPHYLGGGIGLMASAHLLAAAGGDGLLEIDINPNPLREGLAKPYPLILEGHMFLPQNPGIGVIPDSEVMKKFTVLTEQVRKNER